MHCLIYARVSTGAQAERQLSIPAQLFAMREYAAQRGWSIVEEFTEEGVSARTTARPALIGLLSRCRQSEPAIDVVLVHKLDRVARNLADHVAIQGSLKAANVRLISVTEQLEDSVSGKLVEHVMASIAEFYSANLSEEVKKGLAQRIRQGGWPHLTPPGYRRGSSDKTPRPIEIDPVKGPLLREAFERWAGGAWTQRSLCAWLGQQGLFISKSRLSAILRNPFYCGRIVWKGQEHSGAHPPLISSELFAQVQAVLKAKRQPTVRKSSQWGLLHGLACCECGSVMSSVQHRRFRYYRCRRAQRSHNRCRHPYAPEGRIHQELLEIYDGIALTRLTLHSLRQVIGRRYRADAQEHRHLEDARLARLHELKLRELRLADALAEGLLETDTYRLSMQRIANQRRELETIPAPEGPRLSANASTILELHLHLDKVGQEALFDAVFSEFRIGNGRISRSAINLEFAASQTAAA